MNSRNQFHSKSKSQYTSQEGRSSSKNASAYIPGDNFISSTQLGQSIKISEKCELVNRITNTGFNITELRIVLTKNEYALKKEMEEKLKSFAGELQLKPIYENAEENQNNINLILQYEGRISKLIDKNLFQNQNEDQTTNSTHSSTGIARMSLLKKIASILYFLDKKTCELKISEHHFIIDEKYNLKIGIIPYFNYHPELYMINEFEGKKLNTIEEGEYIASLWMNLLLLILSDTKYRKEFPNRLDFQIKILSKCLCIYWKVI